MPWLASSSSVSLDSTAYMAAATPAPLIVGVALALAGPQARAHIEDAFADQLGAPAARTSLARS